MFRAGFQQWQLTHPIQRLVLDGDQPAALRFLALELYDFIHHPLPGAFRDFGIPDHQVGAGDLQIDHRLPVGFIAGLEQPPGFEPVFGAEAFLFSGFVVLKPVNGSPSEHAVCRSHNFLVTSLTQPDFPRYRAVSESGQCRLGAVGVSPILLTFLLTVGP